MDDAEEHWIGLVKFQGEIGIRLLIFSPGVHLHFLFSQIVVHWHPNLWLFFYFGCCPFVPLFQVLITVGAQADACGCLRHPSAAKYIGAWPISDELSSFDYFV